MGAAPLRAVDYRIRSPDSQDGRRAGCCAKDTASRIRAKISHVRLMSGASVPLWLFMLHQAKTATMQQIPRHTTTTSESARRRLGRVRAILLSLIAFVMAVQGVALASPWAQNASHKEIAAVSIAAVADCAQDDTRSPANDGHAHKCSLAGLCCSASYEVQTFGLPGAAFSLAPWRRLAADAVKPHAPARSRLAQAGWASAWSSRAPPRHA